MKPRTILAAVAVALELLAAVVFSWALMIAVGWVLFALVDVVESAAT